MRPTLFGQPTEQIFDLCHHRWPLQYNLSDKAERKAKAKEVTDDLKKAIVAVDAEVHEEALRKRGRLDVGCMRLIEACRHMESFADPPPEHAAAVIRLLDLDILYADMNPATKMYGYHWTYLGRCVHALFGES
jgi:hypothetical protein